MFWILKFTKEIKSLLFILFFLLQDVRTLGASTKTNLHNKLPTFTLLKNIIKKANFMRQKTGHGFAIFLCDKTFTKWRVWKEILEGVYL